MNAVVEEILNNAKADIEKSVGYEVELCLVGHPTEKNILKLQRAICKAYGITWESLLRKSRVPALFAPRQMFHYWALERFGMGCVEAGKFFGHHHTTVLYHRDTVKGFIDVEDAETMERLKRINEYLRNTLNI